MNAVVSYFKMLMVVNTSVSELYDGVEAFYRCVCASLLYVSLTNIKNSALVPVFSSSEGVYLVDYIKYFSSRLVAWAFLVSCHDK